MIEMSRYTNCYAAMLERSENEHLYKIRDNDDCFLLDLCFLILRNIAYTNART